MTSVLPPWLPLLILPGLVALAARVKIRRPHGRPTLFGSAVTPPTGGGAWAGAHHPPGQRDGYARAMHLDGRRVPVPRQDLRGRHRVTGRSQTLRLPSHLHAAPAFRRPMGAAATARAEYE